MLGKTLVILGAGGFAREVLWHMQTCWQNYYNIFFVDDVTETQSISIPELGNLKVIKDWQFPNPDSCEFIVGIGSPFAKITMVQKALAAGLKPAPTFIHGRALVQDAKVGVGGIITPGVVITTNVKIGDYVIFNLNSTVGHDAVIGDYCTVNPGCSISGNTFLNRGVTLGTGTVTREKILIAEHVTVGAQSAVIKNLLEDGITAVGAPAKKMERK